MEEDETRKKLKELKDWYDYYLKRYSDTGKKIYMNKFIYFADEIREEEAFRKFEKRYEVWNTTILNPDSTNSFMMKNYGRLAEKERRKFVKELCKVEKSVKELEDERGKDFKIVEESLEEDEYLDEEVLEIVKEKFKTKYRA